jgi:hypothetical protein
MRAKPSEIVFKEWLCDMGGGKLPGKEISSHESLIELPDNMVVGDGAIKELINFVFGESTYELNENLLNKNVAVLCPKNQDALVINEAILEKLHEVKKTYFSEDVVEYDDESEPQEYP